MDLTTAIIRAWVACADEDFGGSLDDGPHIPRYQERRQASGIPYVYRSRWGWQAKPPGARSKLFHDGELEDARAYVARYVGEK